MERLRNYWFVEYTTKFAMSTIKQALHVSRYVVKRAQNLFYYYETDILILSIASTLTNTPKPVMDTGWCVFLYDFYLTWYKFKKKVVH